MVISDDVLVACESDQELASDWPCGWEEEHQQAVTDESVEDSELASDWPCNWETHENE